MPFDITQLSPEEIRQFINDTEAYLDSLPAPEPQPIIPCCGHCIHFEVRDIDGIQGVCRAKTYRDWDAGRSFLTLNPEREVTDEPCNLYKEASPL
jgi:hypothetical protein